jgi:hypothetical protein
MPENGFHRQGDELCVHQSGRTKRRRFGLLDRAGIGLTKEKRRKRKKKAHKPLTKKGVKSKRNQLVQDPRQQLRAL